MATSGRAKSGARLLLERQAKAVALEKAIDAQGSSKPEGAALDDAHRETDPFGRFLKIEEVSASVGLCRAMVYRLIREQHDPFPAPLKIGTASLWVEREVVAWKARRVESRRR